MRIAPAPSSAPSKEDRKIATCHKPFLFLRFMAGTTGLEPATSAVTVMLNGCKQMISWALMANYSTLEHS